MIKIKSSTYILSLLLISSTIVSMDQRSRHERQIVTARLLIDHKIDATKGYLIKIPVQYLTKEQRQTFPFTKTLERLPLTTPFLNAIFINNETGEKIRTILPAPKLTNCNDGSVTHFNTPDRIFHLTCAKNDKLVINPKYFPKDKQGNTFETQFLSCMNHFYNKITYIGDNPIEKNLIQNNILYITDKGSEHIPLGDPTQILPDIFRVQILILPKTTYAHGPKGCATPEHLVKLATNPRTKSNGYSIFNHVMNRQQTNKPSPKAPQFNPAETGRLACYYNYLENVKNVGNKSSMPKTVHSSKNPSIDVPNNTPMNAEEAPDQAILNTILEDYLIEFADQEKIKAAVLDNVIESCLISLAVKETEVPGTNNSRPQCRDGLIGNECVI